MWRLLDLCRALGRIAGWHIEASRSPSRSMRLGINYGAILELETGQNVESCDMFQVA